MNHNIIIGIKNGKILRLCFNDIIRPYKNLRVITQNDIEKIVNFVKQNGRSDILIHCYAGVSRSIAITMFLMFLLEKNIKVDEVVSMIKNKAPFANPNKLVLMQAGRVMHQEKFFVDLIKYFKGIILKSYNNNSSIQFGFNLKLKISTNRKTCTSTSTRCMYLYLFLF